VTQIEIYKKPRLQKLQSMFKIKEMVKNANESIEERKKVKQSRYRPRGFQEVKVPKFRDNGTGWW